jgi:hypothetical protein
MDEIMIERNAPHRSRKRVGTTRDWLLPALAATAIVALSGCEPSVAEPTQGLAVLIKAPLGSENPFSDANAAFVALVAEGPGISTVPNEAPQTVQPFVGAGQTLKMPAVPYGAQRQIRVEIYPKDSSGLPSLPVLARGRTTPKDVNAGETFLVHAYVSRTNAWTVPISNESQEALTGPRHGAAIEQLPDGSVLIAGGADVIGGKPIFEGSSLGTLSKAVLRYDVDKRVVQNLSGAIAAATLTVGRAMMASTVGPDGQAVFSGGYVAGDLGPVASTLMEYWDPKEGAIKQAGGAAPHLEYARAHHTINRLFDGDSYYIVAGGKGSAAEAAVSWEIWHPVYGRLQKGSLSKPRWNHSAVRLPETDGGYIMLIGGENDSGVIDDFEVLRYDTRGNVSFKGNTKLTCQLGDKVYNGPDSNTVCASLASQPGYKPFYWEPLVRKLNGSVGRTLAASSFVSNEGANHIYIVGGFADAAKTQPLSRVDVFDIGKGDWAPSVQQLEFARGGTQIAVTRGAGQRGRVVVVGGVGADGKTVVKAEVLAYDAATAAIKRESTDGEVPSGGRVMGRAIGLTTGHVAIFGGAATKDGQFVASDRIGLYNPR